MYIGQQRASPLCIYAGTLVNTVCGIGNHNTLTNAHISIIQCYRQLGRILYMVSIVNDSLWQT